MTSTISASVEREFGRRAKRKLAVLRLVEEVSGSVGALRDRSSALHHSPNARSAEVIEKILWLRQQYRFGSHKIAIDVKRDYDITISPSGVWRILNKLGLSRLLASHRYKRNEIRWKRYY